MLIFYVILVVLACVILGFIVLVQNPKGGGLSGTFGGFSNQIMGVKQTTDVLEKGTWVFAIVVALLCICSTVFIPRAGVTNTLVNDVNTKSAPVQQTAPAAQPTTAPTTPANPK